MTRPGKKTEIEILKLYTTNLSGEFHLRELARKLEMDHTSIRPYLDSLRSKGIIAEERKGRNKIFSLNPAGDLSLYYLIQAEADRTAEFLNQNKVIHSFWRSFQDRIPFNLEMNIETLVLFGSFAKGTEDNSSDLDLFISLPKGVREEFHRTVNKLEAVVGHPISVEEVQDLRDFITHQASGTFKEIVDNHIVLIGIEPFVRAVRWFVYG